MASSELPSLPKILKPVNKYLTQAKKLDKINPIVAYYSRMYALEMCLKLRGDDKDANVFLRALLQKLENDKKSIPNLSVDSGRETVEEFALKVFDHADGEDRCGNASKNTVLSFVSAYIYMEITAQFGDITSDIQEKIKYAKWRATEISKALKSGRKPQPPLDEDGDGGGGGEMNDDNLGEVSPSPTQQQQQPKDEEQRQQPTNMYQPVANVKPSAPPATAASTTSTTTTRRKGKRVNDKNKLSACIEAEKMCKHAISALRFHDVQTAIEKLNNALEKLQPYNE